MNFCVLQRDPSVSGSVGSLPEAAKAFKRSRTRTSSNYGSGYGSGMLTRHPSTFDLTKSLIKDTYFSDINPRNMRRLMNIIAVTGMLPVIEARVLCHMYLNIIV